MCFHFPVMPMLYYALRDRRAAPIIDVLADTPPIPAGGPVGHLLAQPRRAHLEMVTPEQRAAMYGWYAPDPRMRANVGIRRRLWPLLDNSRAEVELIHALVLSLPGSPGLYYGDEIGMGDNIWLGDRDASRTPMQWTPDRNAGFSSADPASSTSPLSTPSPSTAGRSTSNPPWHNRLVPALVAQGAGSTQGAPGLRGR